MFIFLIILVFLILCFINPLHLGQINNIKKTTDIKFPTTTKIKTNINELIVKNRKKYSIKNNEEIQYNQLIRPELQIELGKNIGVGKDNEKHSKKLSNRGQKEVYPLREVKYNPNETFELYSFEDYKFLGEFSLTCYCACTKCCKKQISDPQYGITSTGTRAIEGRTIAVDPTVIPYGSKVFIEGLGLFIAEDCGSAIKNKKIDIFKQSHAEYRKISLEKANVYIIYNDQSDFPF